MALSAKVEQAISTYVASIDRIQPLVVTGSQAEILAWLHSKHGITYQPKTEMRDLQAAVFALAVLEKSFGVFLGMGLGKSKIALDVASYCKQAGVMNRGMILVPNDPCMLNWEVEVATHSNLVATYAYGTIEQRWESLLSMEGDLQVLPYSGLQYVFSHHDKKKKKRVPDMELIEEYSKHLDLMIIDEAHNYRNPDSLRYRIAEALFKRAKVRLALTGTPTGRDPFGLWSIFKLIDGGQTLTTSFPFFKYVFGKEVYTPFNREKREWVYDEKKKSLLSKAISKKCIYVRTEDALELPPLLQQDIRVGLTPTQKRAYDQVKQEFRTIQIGANEVAVKQVVTKLRQICSGFISWRDEETNEEKLVVFPGVPKLEWLVDTIQDCDVPIFIVHEFVESGRMIQEALAKAKIPAAFLRGETVDKPEEFRKFQDGKVRVLVASVNVGGESLNLHTVGVHIYYEPVYSPISRDQCDRRAMRPNRVGPLIMYHLFAGQVEYDVRNSVAAGGELAKAILKGAASLR
jgi:superfamily II DNA or RNA helicase